MPAGPLPRPRGVVRHGLQTFEQVGHPLAEVVGDLHEVGVRGHRERLPERDVHPDATVQRQPGPLVEVPARRDACVRLLRSFETSYVDDLPQVHQRIGVPVQLVWGEDDPFFPVDWAREMVDTFADARLHAVAGAKLFAHEEHPAEVAAALLEVLSAPRR